MNTKNDRNRQWTPTKKHLASHRRTSRGKSRRVKTGLLIALLLGIALVLLGIIYASSHSASSSPAQTNASSLQIGSPGPGSQAPALRLQGTDGRSFDLASLHGKTVLLFFQEGVSCESCWTQIKDMEVHWQQFQALGIDQMVTITTDPLNALQQKVVDEGISTVALSDPTFAVSQIYHANQYGMMDGSSDGHSFIVVGPDGRIRWRADYGGAPNYTMYVPITTLLTDMKESLNEKP
jgi:peroxiredoxin